MTFVVFLQTFSSTVWDDDNECIALKTLRNIFDILQNELAELLTPKEVGLIKTFYHLLDEDGSGIVEKSEARHLLFTWYNE